MDCSPTMVTIMETEKSHFGAKLFWVTHTFHLRIKQHIFHPGEKQENAIRCIDYFKMWLFN